MRYLTPVLSLLPILLVLACDAPAPRQTAARDVSRDATDVIELSAIDSINAAPPGPVVLVSKQLWQPALSDAENPFRNCYILVRDSKSGVHALRAIGASSPICMLPLGADLRSYTKDTTR